MKKTSTIKSITLLFAFLSAGISFSQNAPQYIADSLQAILNSSLPAVQNPGVVAGVHVPGKWSWYGASGKAISGMTAGHPATAATPTDKFRIGSITKTFAATAIIQLEEAGLLNINDDISLYLRPTLVNDTIKGSAPITIRHLLNHTSGIANAADNDSCKLEALNDLTRNFSLEEAVFCGAIQGEYFPAGFAWGYSNTNYSIIAMIIENVSGKTFPEYITDSIITPLNLQNTEIPSTDEIQIAHMGCYWDIGYLLDMTIVDASLYRGWADIVSTTEDLVTFFQALRSGNLVSQTSLAKMKIIDPVSIDYGLGFDFYTIGGAEYFGHSGEVANTSGMFYSGLSTADIPNGYYITYNFSYQGVDTWTAMDEPVFNLLKNYISSSADRAFEPQAGFDVSPNPASNRLNLYFNTPITNETTVEITDLRGRTLKTITLGESFSAQKTIDISDLENGIYLVKISGQQAGYSKKITVVR